MEDIRRIARAIVRSEGGFVNDPDDPGGATNHGVTLATLRRLGLDLDKNGRVDLHDLKSLDPEQATDIFLRHYYDDPGIPRLPGVVRPSLFDMYVNAGGNAVKILQNLLIEMGLVVEVDGVIGHETASATGRAYAMAPNHLADAYGIARRNYYYRLGDLHKRLRKFVRRRDGGKGGWITRAERFIAPRFRLSAAQHRKRTAAWV